ncbi:phosphomethylpyrimidine kinase [Helicobacter sp. 10-6591]|uniref:DUF2779 domain-containing protein n=2 Tax=Helicobacteraceae TaxID=72293 RepID=A0A3D8IJ05_9HELI|nr:phosphomethylpyrimidine kinase [Helicobacter sp. 10-6591]RDU65307.1 DUF2779 domain-containing protein [Helicobacter equorum]
MQQTERFSVGEDVGILACELFPKGARIHFCDGISYNAKRTKELLDSGTNVIYEATFIYEGIVVMVDILQNTPQGLIINEVKSSTSLKEVYIYDLSVQHYVITHCGYSIKEANLIHLNTDYKRGKSLDLTRLFVSVPCLESVQEFTPKIPTILSDFSEILETKNEPNIDIGLHCDNPYSCEAKSYCWEAQRNITEEDSVFNLAWLNGDKKLGLYRQGIARFSDIKDIDSLNYKQQLQIECFKNKSVHIQKDKIKEFLGSLSYPIYHLDFETFQPAVPRFVGTCAYEQIPFQFSLHIQHKDGKLEHKEFLAKSGIDPRVELIQTLLDSIPPNAFILAYNASFEKGVITRLAASFPQYEKELLHIASQIEDLMYPFAARHYYHYKQNGSHSIKVVLPALVPQMESAYQELSLVHNGGEAMECFATLESKPKKEQEEYRQALLAYCKLDTLAMVEIIKALEKLVG